jgi:ribosomal protein L12E/L44/L45/RPP1/RPP2
MFTVLAIAMCCAALCDAQMRHLAVYMMLVLGGNATPSKEDVTKALSTVGIEADEARLDHLLSELEGKVCYL